LFKFPSRPQDYPESLAPLLTWIHSLPRSYFLVKVLLSLLRLANASPGTTVCIGLARHFATSVPSLSQFLNDSGYRPAVWMIYLIKTTGVDRPSTPPLHDPFGPFRSSTTGF
ncbi:hypothetical protein CONPUDRAFT_79352, partial [Coniophora puteana RWD-64-598 SS2]